MKKAVIVCICSVFALLLTVLVSCGTAPLVEPSASAAVETPADSGLKQTSSAETAAHEHVFGDPVVLKEPGCLEEGQAVCVCACGERKNVVLPAAGHTPKTDPAVEPTCTEWGVTEGSRCAVCGEILKMQLSRPPLGHDFANGVCTRCGAPRQPSEGLVFNALNSDCLKLVDVGTCKDKEILIPAEYDGRKVTVIGKNAFSGKSVTGVLIPEGVRVIEEGAFRSCGLLESVSIPETVTSIGPEAFRSCKKLKSVTVPDSTVALGKRVFFNCTGLENAKIGGTFSRLADETFRGCAALISVTLPDSLTSIGYYAFGECASLTGVTLPGNVASIGHSAFYACTSLADVPLPESVTSIAESAFGGCAIERIAIPAGVSELPGSAFFQCGALKSVSIPASVVKIGQSAFYECSGLETVRYGGSAEQWGNIRIDARNDDLKNAELICEKN